MKYIMLVLAMLFGSVSYAGECSNGSCRVGSRVVNVTKEVVRVPVNVTRRAVTATTNVARGTVRTVRNFVVR